MNHLQYYTNLVWANERRVEPEYLTARTRSEVSTMCWLIVRGSVRISENNQSLEAKSGQWLFLKSTAVKQEFSPRSRILSIRFDFKQRGGAPVFRRQRNLIFEANHFPDLERSARDLVREFRPWMETQSLLSTKRDIPLEKTFAIEAAFNQWLSAYTSTMKVLGAQLAPVETMDERVIQALTHIDAFPRKEKFQEAILAQTVGLSVNQLCRLFKKDTGTTPHAYYEKRRLEAASNALSMTAMPIKEIAYELGFGSSSNFSNWFSKQTGTNPRQFRKDASHPQSGSS